MKQTLRYDQPSCRLRVDGLPDVSIGQFGIIEFQLQRRRVGLAAAQLQTVMAALRGRRDPNRILNGAERPAHPADQVSGIGKHHRHQGQQVILAPLQFGTAAPLQAPAGDDAESIG